MKDNMKPSNFRACIGELAVKANVTAANEKVVNGKDYIYYGEDNLYPEMLYGCYSDCSILQSAINSLCDYVVGGGIDGGDFEVDSDGGTMSELLARLCQDYIVFGAFAVEIVRNKNGEAKSLYWVDVANIRLGYDEKADTAYYCPRWGKYARDIKAYPLYDYKSNGHESVEIYYCKSPKSRGIYGSPIWSAAVRDVLTLIEASKRNYSDIRNGFSPNTLISFNNGVPDSDVQDEIEERIIEKYSGSDGNKILLSWSDSREASPEVSTFAAEDYTAKYQAVMASARDSILAALRMSAQLAGITTQATGFSDIEYMQSYALFRDTVARPLQKEIERAMGRIGVDIRLLPFAVEFAETNNQDNETEVTA